MATTSEDSATKIFQNCRDVASLTKSIKDNCHLWFDEDKTIYMLSKVANDCKINNDVRIFATLLISKTGIFALKFKIYPDSIVELVDC